MFSVLEFINVVRVLGVEFGEIGTRFRLSMMRRRRCCVQFSFLVATATKAIFGTAANNAFHLRLFLRCFSPAHVFLHFNSNSNWISFATWVICLIHMLNAWPCLVMGFMYIGPSIVTPHHPIIGFIPLAKTEFSGPFSHRHMHLSHCTPIPLLHPLAQIIFYSLFCLYFHKI